jgi:hypothetical protein
VTIWTLVISPLSRCSLNSTNNILFNFYFQSLDKNIHNRFPSLFSPWKHLNSQAIKKVVPYYSLWWAYLNSLWNQPNIKWENKKIKTNYTLSFFFSPFKTQNWAVLLFLLLLHHRFSSPNLSQEKSVEGILFRWTRLIHIFIWMCTGIPLMWIILIVKN